MGIDVQIATRAAGVPDAAELTNWAAAALEESDPDPDPDLTLRIVGRPEGHRLNRKFRNADRATNVLAFPFESPPGINVPILGDVVICAPVVAREAQRQGKSLRAHYAHLVVHGILHLRGFDHEDGSGALAMEALETALLCRLGFPDPYAIEPVGECS